MLHANAVGPRCPATAAAAASGPYSDALCAPSPSCSLLRVKPQSDQDHTWPRAASTIHYQVMDLNVKFRKRPQGAQLFRDATQSTRTGERAWCFQERELDSC